MLDLDLYGGTDPLGMLPLFLKRTDVMAPRLSVVFRRLVRLGTNQPHLLNKYQINMGFSHFHEFGILSGMYILAPYQIDIVKACGFCNGNIILI